METPTATLTENQLLELQASQAALARVAAEEKADVVMAAAFGQAVPISTRAPAAKPSHDHKPDLSDWKLCDVRTDAKFAALLGLARECPYPLNPEKSAWLKEYDRAKSFSDSRKPEEKAFDSGWAIGFHFPNRIGFPVPQGELGRLWRNGFARGIDSRHELERSDPCLHNPGEARPIQAQAIAKTPTAITIHKAARATESIVKQVLAARKAGMSFREMDLKFRGKAQHGGWSAGVCKRHGGEK